VSADGRLVAFESRATDLLTRLTSGRSNIFVRDLISGATTLVSVDSSGSQDGNNDSFFPSISADGKFVAFESTATNLLTNPSSGRSNIFVRDLTKGTTTLVSAVDSSGSQDGNDDSSFPSISADGRFVAFESIATNLLTSPTSGTSNIFVRDLMSGTTTLVSVDSSGSQDGNNHSFFPSISTDGRFVAFNSRAKNLLTKPTSGRNNVFVRDLASATTTLVSLDSSGSQDGNNDSLFPSISADGKYVAFESRATNLLTNPTSGRSNIFVRDLASATTTLVSLDSSGSQDGNNDSFVPSISADGRFVAFESRATDLLTSPTSGRSNIFIRDLISGTTTLISINKAATLDGNNNSFVPSISSTGKFVAFESLASNLVDDDTNGLSDIFLRNRDADGDGTFD
jgi:hypothetical protein